MPTARTNAVTAGATLLTSVMAALVALWVLAVSVGGPDPRLGPSPSDPAAIANLSDSPHRLARRPVSEPILRPATSNEVAQRSSRPATKRPSLGGESTPVALLPDVPIGLPLAHRASDVDSACNAAPAYGPTRRTHRPRDPPRTA